ncbi:hypothetical protein P7H79_05775 [Lactococcus lactis]|uniref:hypothetical protein n=1 Tax=Lactococcus lactis TaxID=1358 RepID=UPI00289202F1|nr:hypothetical protein [Lactococcus lactis]MDT2872877.1 hypothetical protein [Lactococcus lactis]MDT2934714.1 hypothetical protein [Lactococcus lactis]
MNINIDFGNLWDALSAIGTIGAVIVSLWLASREQKIDFSVELSSALGIRDNDSVDESVYLYAEVLNKSKFPLTVEEVGFYNKKKSKRIVVLDQRYLVEGSDKIPTKVDTLETAKYIFEQDKIVKLAKKTWGENVKIRAYVRDTTKKTHYSKKYKI